MTVRQAPSRQNQLPLRLDEQFCFTLYSTMLGINKVYRRLLRDLGVTYPQYLVLLILWETNHQTVSELGAALFLDSATLTPLLKRMEALGLVERVRVKGDERFVSVSLTRQGKDLKRKAQKIPGLVLCATGKSVDQINRLRDELADLRENLLRDDASA